jgi:copper chaperone
METQQFNVVNVKCQGCANNIQEGLGVIVGVETVSVDVATGKVEVTGADMDRQNITAKLAELGYPER